PPSTADEIAALRQQLESLRTEVARTRPETTTGASPAAGTSPARRARALVIGNGRYTGLGPLPNPRRDAEAIAAKLRGYGIEVDLHLDTDRSALVRALANFQTRSAGHDVNILFYAGHGLQVAGTNYIVPVDMQGEGATVGSVKLNGISLDDALEYLPAPTRIVFLDACRDNPVARSLRATRSSAGLGLAPMSTVSGTLLSYATRDGSTAEDGTGKNSPYTTALLRHLDADEDIALVLRRVRQEVLDMTGQRQEPWEYGSLVGGRLVLSRLAK
ncbi:MAG: caspase family protein, partial [Rubrivivax sp.]|nr:caspase family protein [Rubrivivax sp.]